MKRFAMYGPLFFVLGIGACQTTRGETLRQSELRNRR